MTRTLTEVLNLAMKREHPINILMRSGTSHICKKLAIEVRMGKPQSLMGKGGKIRKIGKFLGIFDELRPGDAPDAIG